MKHLSITKDMCRLVAKYVSRETSAALFDGKRYYDTLVVAPSVYY